MLVWISAGVEWRLPAFGVLSVAGCAINSSVNYVILRVTSPVAFQTGQQRTRALAFSEEQ